MQLAQARGATRTVGGLPGSLRVEVQVEAVGSGGILAAATAQAAGQGPAFTSQGQGPGFRIGEVVLAAESNGGAAGLGPLALTVIAGNGVTVGESVGAAVREVAADGNALAAVGVRTFPGVGPLIGAAARGAAGGWFPVALGIEHQLGGVVVGRLVGAAFEERAAVAPAIPRTAPDALVWPEAAKLPEPL